MWLKDANSDKIKSTISNKMRHFLQLDPNSTTLYFKDHSASIKDNSTMKNATGFRFEKKSAADNSGNKDRNRHSGGKKYDHDYG